MTFNAPRRVHKTAGGFSRARWSRTVIIIASFLFLLIHLPVGSQTPTPTQRFIRRPFPIATPTASPIDLTVSLQADKRTVQIGEPVRFWATLSRPLPGLVYEFEADGKVIKSGFDQTEAVGTFSTRGPHVVTVHVRPRGAPPLRPSTTTIQVTDVEPNMTPPKVDDSPPNPAGPLSVQLAPHTVRVRVGEIVTFTVSTIPKVRNLNYEFDPGDGSGAKRGNAGKITWKYSRPKSYRASVTLVDSKLSASATISVDPLPPRRSISPRPPSFPWKYVILVGLVVATLGYLFWPVPPPPLPTFHPHWDRAAPQKQPENVTINYELHFDPNLSNGRRRLETGGANLIISIKKKP